jgi:hypothetical protein
MPSNVTGPVLLLRLSLHAHVHLLLLLVLLPLHLLLFRLPLVETLVRGIET